MVKFLQKKLNNYFQKRDFSDDEIELYIYGLKSIGLKILHFIIYMCVALIFNKVIEFTIFLINYSIIRGKIGGYHAKSPIICDVISFIIALGLVAYNNIANNFINNNWLVIVVVVLSIVIWLVTNEKDRFTILCLLLINAIMISYAIFYTSMYLIVYSYTLLINFFLYTIGRIEINNNVQQYEKTST